MTRAEQLRWWRAGYDAGQAARIDDRRQLAELAQAVREFDAYRRAERQAAIDRLLGEVIGVLATAMLGEQAEHLGAELMWSA